MAVLVLNCWSQVAPGHTGYILHAVVVVQVAVDRRCTQNAGVVGVHGHTEYTQDLEVDPAEEGPDNRLKVCRGTPLLPFQYTGHPEGQA